jgi:hypothetical protein
MLRRVQGRLDQPVPKTERQLQLVTHALARRKQELEQELRLIDRELARTIIQLSDEDLNFGGVNMSEMCEGFGRNPAELEVMKRQLEEQVRNNMIERNGQMVPVDSSLFDLLLKEHNSIEYELSPAFHNPGLDPQRFQEQIFNLMRESRLSNEEIELMRTLIRNGWHYLVACMPEFLIIFRYFLSTYRESGRGDPYNMLPWIHWFQKQIWLRMDPSRRPTVLSFGKNPREVPVIPTDIQARFIEEMRGTYRPRVEEA